MIRRSSLVALLLSLVATAAHAQQPKVVPAVKLTVARDSFFIMVNARAMGTTIYDVSATDAGYRVTENTSMPSMGVQVTEVLTDKAGHPLKVTQTGKMAGQEVGLTLAYANGHAKGTAKVPNSQMFSIDTAVPANVIDDNMLQAILPGLVWAPNAKWDLPVFSGGGNALSTQTLTVTDELEVSIPSGKYAAYRAELRGGDAIVAFYISKAAPHKVLKIVPGGAPFEFVRAN